MKQEHAQVTRGKIPLTVWQIDYMGPLPKAQGASYALIAVDMAIRLLFAWPCAAAEQRHTVQALKCLHAFYRRLLVVESDQGTHFTGHKV